MDWLATQDGLSLVHAVTLLAVAGAGYLNWRTHRKVAEVEDKVDANLATLTEHLIQHIVSDPPPGHHMQ